jgi:hypothetical protein
MCVDKTTERKEMKKEARRVMTPISMRTHQTLSEKQAKGRNMTIVRVDQRSSV